MSFGWTGVVLRVDLSSQKIMKEPLEEELQLKYYGGRGLNIKFLYDELKPGIDPLGPDNKIIFGTGPCNGTLVPSSQRFTVTTKSPMTGFLGDSNCGSSFGAKLKYAGYDMLVIQGKAERPVYLWIDDDKVELRDAEHLWGKTTYETKSALEVELGDPEISVVSIGPAGEKLVKFASIMGDLGRAAGRTGVGTVLGLKKVKAIAVRGTKGVKVANPDLLCETWKEMYAAWHDQPEDEATFQGLTAMGVNSAMLVYNMFGCLPTKNYLQGTYEDIHLVTGQRLAEWYFFKPKACFSCPTPCDHLYVVDRGPYIGTYGDSMELAQTEHFSSRIMNNDLGLAAKMSALCDQYGMDMMEMAHIIGFTMECFDKGILTKEDTGGLKVEWGDAAASLKLIEMTAHREGFGDLFAEGVKRAADRIGKGAENIVVSVKGMAISTRDGRPSKAWALGYAVAARGADHCRAMIFSECVFAGGEQGFDPVQGDVFGVPGTAVDPLTEEGKGRMVKWYEDVRAFENCMENCLFSIMRYPKKLGMPGILAKLYSAVTGRVLSAEDVMHIGERIVNLERAFNVREGLTRKDDTLPKRFLEESLPDGPAKGQTVKLEPMLDEYYQLRGWEKDTGFPTREKLEELDLKEVADELESMGRLGV